MYQGNVATVSNRASWVQDWQAIDDETDEPYDISDATEITVGIYDPCGRQVLAETLTGGELELVDNYTLRWNFTKQQMGALCYKTYNLAITIEINGETVEPLNGTVSVVEGYVT